MPELDLPSTHLDVDAIALPRVARALAEGCDPGALPGIAIADILKRDVLYVLSVMLQPEPSFDHHRLGRDADLQHAHHAMLAAGKAGWVVDGSIYPELHERTLEPDQLINDLMRGPSLAGYAVSWILRWVVRRHADRSRPRAAGRGAAFAAFEHHCWQCGKIGGTVAHLKENIWPRYGPIAHLWAAFHTLAECKLDLLEPAGFGLFLGTAAAYMECGCQIVPKQARQPFLDRHGAWMVPDQWIVRAPDHRILNSLQLG